jgi:CheY-like chemotaxis protein
LVTLLEPDLGFTEADPSQIEQVIINLAVNSRDAMPRGGKLTIETANVELDESYTFRDVNFQPGSYVMLAVSDNGSGMDQETLSNIFEPFFTTKGREQGTGLGLATVYGIVKQSGGYIWVYSEPQWGTTFKIYLPRVASVLEEDHPRPELALPCRGWETILLVEDEEVVRDFASSVLEKNGYQVLAARDGQEALALCARYRAPIHLLLTDVVMPGLSGRELAERLTAQSPETRVLFITGYAENAIHQHGILDPDIALLVKPFTPAALAQKVRKVLDAPPMAAPRPERGVNHYVG